VGHCRIEHDSDETSLHDIDGMAKILAYIEIYSADFFCPIDLYDAPFQHFYELEISGIELVDPELSGGSVCFTRKRVLAKRG